MSQVNNCIMCYDTACIKIKHKEYYVMFYEWIKIDQGR